MKKTRTLAMMTLLIGLSLLSQSCATPARSGPLPVTRRDSTAEIVADPDFPRLAAAAPGLMKRILRTITRLDTELANAGHASLPPVNIKLAAPMTPAEIWGPSECENREARAEMALNSR